MKRSCRIIVFRTVGIVAAAAGLTLVTALSASADRIDVPCPDVAPTVADCQVSVELSGGGNRPPKAEVFAFFKGLNDPQDGSSAITLQLDASVR